MKLTESKIEDYAIKLFEKLGYHYLHSEHLDRDRTTQVILTDRLTAAVNRLNPGIPELARQQANRAGSYRPQRFRRSIV